MSKDDVVQPAPAAESVPNLAASPNLESSGQQTTAGALLREARQSQKLDTATLAALLKVPAHKLEALEQDRIDLLPDPVFTRALASSLCRILKLDPEPVLHRLPAISAFKLTPQNRGINAPFRSRSGRHAPPLWTHISRPAVLVGLALLAGTLVLVFLPTIQQEIARYRQLGENSASLSKTVEPAFVTTTVTTPIPSGNEISAASAHPSSGVSALSISPALLPVPATLSNTHLSSRLENATAANSEATITFNAKGTSRVKVTDAKGLLVLDRALRAGESADVSGLAPLTAVVSRASVIQVQVRGQAFDLGGVTSNNIARFEVK